MKPCFLIALLLLAFIMPAHAQGPDWKWAITAGGVDAATDNEGNIYLTGYVIDSVIIGSTVLKNSAGYADIYLAKIDPSGKVIWAKTTPGNNNELASGIALDNAGNIYLNASVKISTLPFVFNATTLNTFGSDDFLFAKYDNNGNLLWARTAGGPDLDFTFADGISCDGAGNFVITGKFGTYCVFGNDTLFDSGTEDIVIAKYNTNGDVVWAKSAGGKKSDRGFSLTSDAAGNVYATGYYTDTAWFDNTMVTAGDGLAHTYIAKYGAAGQLQWAKSTGGAFGSNIVVDASAFIYLTGKAGSSDTFDGIHATGNGYSFLAKCDNTGKALWAYRSGRNGNGLSDIEVDPDGNIYFSADSIVVQKFTGYGQSLWEVINPKPDYSAILTSDNNGNIYASGNIHANISIGSHTVAAPHYLARLSPFPASVPEVAERSINLYPNPANTQLHIEGTTLKTYSITEVLGRKILEGETIDNAIDIHTLSPGNYILNFQLDGKESHAKFVKQ
ncbi:T9SS type A sorting domain-containing protein [Polluticoccus soli]|uniref:T9SS type A sorting domain-containing protein n=1 Tax=Polluticoccus soli TaxID=3034150 RepID=UPI0023E22E9C|nr:T9SS type A sorting domain-containing protein [Flavipsychrobacter sp. JY13-12]